MEKKEIESKVAIKGLVNGFIAYGFLIFFIVVSVIVFVCWRLNQSQDSVNYEILEFTLPIIAAFLIYFLVRRICQLSSYDLFKKCKIKQEDIEKVTNKMNLFFIGLAIFIVIVFILLLTIKFNNEKISIYQISDEYYSIYSEEFAENLTLDLIYKFQEEKYIFSLQAGIIEIGLLAGIFSLVSCQKKFIERYNYVEKSNEPEKITK